MNITVLGFVGGVELPVGSGDLPDPLEALVRARVPEGFVGTPEVGSP